MMNASTVAPVPLSYYVKQSHTAHADRMRNLLNALWMNWTASGVDNRLWRNSDMRILLKPENYNGRQGPWVVKYKWNGWEPDADFQYQDANLDDAGDADFPGHAYLVDLRESDSPLKISETESLTIEQERSVSVTKGLQVDVGVEATQTISGGYAGVGFEGSLKESLNVSSSQETQQAQSDSTSKTVEKSIEYEAEPRKMTLIRFTSKRVTSRRSFSVDGAFTFGITLMLDMNTWMQNAGHRLVIDGYNDSKWVNADDWWSDHNGSWKYIEMDFPTLDSFVQAFEGHNDNYPEFGQINWGSKADDLAWLYDKANRSVTLSGIETHDYGEEPTIQIDDVTSEELEAVQKKWQITDDHILRPAA